MQRPVWWRLKRVSMRIFQNMLNFKPAIGAYTSDDGIAK